MGKGERRGRRDGRREGWGRGGGTLGCTVGCANRGSKDGQAWEEAAGADGGWSEEKAGRVCDKSSLEGRPLRGTIVIFKESSKVVDAG